MKVRVSAYLTVSEWVDPLSKIQFNKDVEIEVPYDVDLTNIRNWIRLNYLYVVSGSIKDLEEKKSSIAKVKAQKQALEEEKKEVAETAAQVLEEQREGIVEEPPVEAKPKTRKRKN